GTAQGYGIRDTESENYVDVQLDPVLSGHRWDEIVLRRDWSTETTSLAVIQGGSTRALPTRNKQPGILDDQPIALARVQAGEQYVTDVVDLRCWAGDGGLTAVDTLALAYLDIPGTRVTIGDQTYTNIVRPNGTTEWHQKLVQRQGLQPVDSLNSEYWARSLYYSRIGDQVSLAARPYRQQGEINIPGYRSLIYFLPSFLRPTVEFRTSAISQRVSESNRGLFQIEINTNGSVAIYNSDPNFNITPGTTYHFNAVYQAAN